MSETQRILDQLRRSFERESWHGPAVRELLDGVTAVEAEYRPLDSVHSIAELVRHMTTWKRVVAERVQGRSWNPSPEEDWPQVAPDPAAWPEAVAGLEAAHRLLLSAAAGLTDADLEQSSAASRNSRYVLLHGAVQHDLYHAGQIAILKKLARSRS